MRIVLTYIVRARALTGRRILRNSLVYTEHYCRKYVITVGNHRAVIYCYTYLPTSLSLGFSETAYYYSAGSRRYHATVYTAYYTSSRRRKASGHPRKRTPTRRIFVFASAGRPFRPRPSSFFIEFLFRVIYTYIYVGFVRWSCG